MFSGRQAWANRVDPDQTPQNAASDQGLHCLPLNQQFYIHSQVIKWTCWRENIRESVPNLSNLSKISDENGILSQRGVRPNPTKPLWIRPCNSRRNCNYSIHINKATGKTAQYGTYSNKQTVSIMVIMHNVFLLFAIYWQDMFKDYIKTVLAWCLRSICDQRHSKTKQSLVWTATTQMIL